MKIKTFADVDGNRRFTGTLVGATEAGFMLEIDGDTRAFVYDDVAKARTVFEWGGAPKPGQGDKRSSIPESQRGSLMNQDMMEALQALATDRGISVDALFGALADALEHAYKRMPDAYEYAWVTINPETMEFQVFAQELDEDGEPVGDEFEVTPTTSDALQRKPPAR